MERKYIKKTDVKPIISVSFFGKETIYRIYAIIIFNVGQKYSQSTTIFVREIRKIRLGKNEKVPPKFSYKFRFWRKFFNIKIRKRVFFGLENNYPIFEALIYSP